LIITSQIIDFLVTELRPAVRIGHFYRNKTNPQRSKLAAWKLDPASQTLWPAVEDASGSGLIIIVDICKAPTLRLKALNKHSIAHIMYIEMENVIRKRIEKTTT